MAQPYLLNANIDVNNISKYANNKSAEMLFDAMSKFAAQAQEVQKKRETASIANTNEEENQAFEAEWLSDPTIYQDEEKYTKMLEAKDELISRQKERLINSEHLTADELNAFTANIDRNAGEFTFNTMSKRQEIFLKDAVDETLLEIQRTQSLAINTNTGTARNGLINSALESINSLDRLGISKAQQQSMAMDLHTNVILGDIDLTYKKIMADPAITDKTTAFEQATENLADPELIRARVDTLSQQSHYTDNDEYRTLMYENTKKNIQENYIDKKEGALNRTEQWAAQARDEDYKTRMRIAEEQERVQKEYNSTIQGITTNLSSGNEAAAISKAEGIPVQRSDFANSETMTTKYYGDTMDRLVKKGQYIPAMSNTEINDLKNFSRVQNENGVSRSETLTEIQDRLGEFEYDFESENAMLQLVDKGVISQAEYDLMNKGYGLEYIDTIKLGENTNKAKGVLFSQINPKFNITKSIGKMKVIGDPILTQYREAQTTKYMIGLVESGAIVDYPAEKGYNATGFRIAYETSPEFKRYFDEATDVFGSLQQTKTKRANIKRSELYNTVNAQQDATVKIRRGSQERKGTTEAKIDVITKRKIQDDAAIFEANTFGE